MKRQKRTQSLAPRKSQAGMTLLETLVAVALLLIVSVGVMSMVVTALSTTENQGHLAARTAEYAQDKMEQLLVLAFGDTTTDTTVFPASPVGGQGLAVGGSPDPNNPALGYVDYLDVNGRLLGANPAGGWFYIRVWQITSLSANLKQVTVTARVAAQMGGSGALPQSTVVTLKAKLNPF